MIFLRANLKRCFWSSWAVLLAFASPATVHAETWKIITLDWPPYTDDHLPDNGVGAKALSEALKAVGVEVEYVFMPWTRGSYEVMKNEYVGIFPVWTEKTFFGAKLSPPLFQSPLGFAYNKNKPYPWKTLQDFKGLRVGVVQDYNYPGGTVRKLGAEGLFSLHSVNTDEQNLFKVAYKRIDVTYVDLMNARFLVEVRNPQLKDLITIDPKVYKNADLFIALKNDSHFEARTRKLQQALQKVPLQKNVDKSLKEILK